MTPDASYWESRWQNAQTGWDLHAPSPPLMAYAAQIDPSQRPALRVLIPGCGNAYEAPELLRLGFSNITLLDFAPLAVQQLRERLDRVAPGWEKHIRLLCGDFFDVEGSYDLVLEQTFFCALQPSLRLRYAQKMYDLLAPGGKLAGVLYDREFEGGPPFGGRSDEYRKLFQPLFQVKTLAPCYNSIPPRAGTEVFVIFEKKGH